MLAHGSVWVAMRTGQSDLVSVTLAGMSEALVYGTKAGIDPALLVESYECRAGALWALDIKRPKSWPGILNREAKWTRRSTTCVMLCRWHAAAFVPTGDGAGQRAVHAVQMLGAGSGTMQLSLHFSKNWRK